MIYVRQLPFGQESDKSDVMMQSCNNSTCCKLTTYLLINATDNKSIYFEQDLWCLLMPPLPSPTSQANQKLYSSSFAQTAFHFFSKRLTQSAR